jgi:hypothetical protein
MQSKTQLLAGAALGLMLAGVSGAAADAAPKHHRAARHESASSAEVRALEAKVEALEARLAAQEQSQQQTQAQVQQAQTTAQTAADQAREAQSAAAAQIQTIPAQVKTEVAANRPKPGWEANTSVNGRMYYDLSNIEQKRDGAKISPSGTGFDVKRFYVGIDHKFNDTFSANVTTDVQYNSAESLTQVYIKKAYLQAKFNDLMVLRLGSADLPWVPFVEDVYGYRFVENTIADRTKFATSADWGAHLLGKYGIVSYQLSLINGAGYKNPVRTKTMDVEGRVSVAYHGLTGAIGGYTGKLGKDVTGGVATPHTASRFDALLAYVQPQYRIGVEYFAANDWNNVTTAASDKADGYSVFGNFNFTPKLAAFGRWDHVKPSKSINSSLKDDYFNVGLNYEPAKIVDFALVYKRDSVEHGLLSTSNGTIGSPVLVSGKGTYDEVGLFGQFRW